MKTREQLIEEIESLSKILLNPGEKILNTIIEAIDNSLENLKKLKSK